MHSQLFEGYGPPGNIFSLGSQQFMRNMNAMKGEYNDENSENNMGRFELYYLEGCITNSF